MTKDLKTITILFRAQESLSSVIKNDIKKYHLNPTEFGTMEALYHKGTMTVALLLEKVLIANSSMSYVLSTLEKKGYIKKIQDKSDKRSYLVSLTDKGQETFDSIYEDHQHTMRSYLDILSVTEEATLQQLLKKLGKNLKEVNQ